MLVDEGSTVCHQIGASLGIRFLSATALLKIRKKVVVFIFQIMKKLFLQKPAVSI